MPGCQQKVKCEITADGQAMAVSTDFHMDANAVCEPGIPPTVGCKQGYILADDGVTCEGLAFFLYKKSLIVMLESSSRKVEEVAVVIIVVVAVVVVEHHLSLRPYGYPHQHRGVQSPL